MSSSNELEVLEHYNKKILKYADEKKAEDILLRSLAKLDQVRVNILLLQTTGVGRTVSSLKKKYPDTEIDRIARDLVAKWKDVVTREEEEEMEEKDSGEENAPPPQPDYVPTPIVQEYVPTQGYTPTPIVQLSEEGEKEERRKKEKEDKRRKEKARSCDKEKKREEEKKEERRREKKEGETKHREKSSKEDDDNAKARKSSSSSKSSSSHSSSSSSKHHSSSDRSSSSSKHRSETKLREEKEVKVKKEPREEAAPPSLNGFDFLSKDSAEEEPRRDDRKRKEERRRKEVKLEPTDEAFTKAMSGLSDTFKKPKRQLEEDEEERRRKRARKEEARATSERTSSLSGYSSSSSGSQIPDISPLYKGGNSLIPDISPVYNPPPRPSNPILASSEPKKKERKPGVDGDGDAETFAIILENKAKGMGQMYSGTARKGFSLLDKHGNMKEVPKLYDQCIQVLKDNVDEIDETGNIPFDILKPVLEHASVKTLMHIEECNSYLIMDTGDMWEKYVKRDFRTKAREDMESYKEMYERCHNEREEKLSALKGKVKNCYKQEKNKHRETKLAYVDIAPKAPRDVRNAQVKNGTFVATGSSLDSVTAKRSRMADPTAGKNMMSSRKPSKAPMMAKAMRMAGKMRR